MWPYVLLGIYSLLIVAASLAGGRLPAMVRLSQRGMQLMMCLVAGLMVGVAVLHLMPHSVAETGSIDTTAMWILAGLLVMWALVRLFHFHQHVAVDPEGHVTAVECEHEHVHADGVEHAHHHAAEDVHHAHDHSHHHRVHEYSWVGVALGLGLHTFIDGIALGAAVHAEAGHGSAAPLFGLGVFLAILLHKPMDALAITALMGAAGWPVKAQNLVNVAFAAMCPVGAAAVIFGTGHFDQSQHMVIGCALAFSAGVFLWISLGDLLPDVHFHSGDAAKFAIALLLGVAIAWGIGKLEGQHVHGDHSQQQVREPGS